MAGHGRRQLSMAASAGSPLLLMVIALVLMCCAVIPASAELKASMQITSPFEKHDHKGSRIIPYWEKTGETNIMQSFVRLTPDKPNKTGTLWSRSAISAPEFSLEWKFRISGTESAKYGDTIALIISPIKYKSGQDGRFFGFHETFTGMAVIINTNRNLLQKSRPGEPMGRHKDISVVANNGTRNYADLIGAMEGCTANVRFDENRDDFNVMQATRIRLKVAGNSAALEVDARNSGRWRRCATMAQLDMPPDWTMKSNVGMIAQTSEKTNNQDLLAFRLYTDPFEAWNVDTYAEEEGDQELNSLVHHMEHELFSVHDSLQETIKTLQDAEEDAEQRLQELEDNLNKNVMTALESRVAKLEVQVQTSVSRSLNKHVDQVYDRLEEDVGGRLTEHVGKMSASWRWPFYFLLMLVFGMVGLSSVKYRQLKKQHLL